MPPTNILGKRRTPGTSTGVGPAIPTMATPSKPRTEVRGFRVSVLGLDQHQGLLEQVLLALHRLGVVCLLQTPTEPNQLKALTQIQSQIGGIQLNMETLVLGIPNVPYTRIQKPQSNLTLNALTGGTH